MPEKLIHCQSCRALLNPELNVDQAPVPEFAPLPELESLSDAPLLGYFVACPACDRELRVRRRYRGMRVQCKFCSVPFDLQPSVTDGRCIALFVECPHCRRELRASWKYLSAKVICKHCNGQIRLVDDDEPAPAEPA